MKNKGFNEILIFMKLHIRHLQIQFAKVTIAGVLDSPVLVLFSPVTSGSGNPELWGKCNDELRAEFMRDVYFYLPYSVSGAYT
jgi:hypothetical protein